MATDKNSNDDLIGQTIAGRYRIISRLGAGGMGVAYRAWDERDGVPVVIKIPKKIFLEDPKFAERFHREIRLLQGLSHPHVVPIRDVGEHEGLPFVVLRFLPGGSLSDRRLRDENGKVRPNPPGMLHLWLPAVAEALDHVHSQGVVHRDVKPANIFFDAFWGAFLGDFGIAKIVEESETFDKEHTLTATHMGIGTAEYMSPEQFTPKALIDGRADQYSLAVMVYEMLAGVRPFTGSKRNLIVEVLEDTAPSIKSYRRDLPSTLVEAAHKGLAKNANDRFATCREFAAAVLLDVPPMKVEPGVARLLCPECSKILTLPTDAAGQKGRCPKCHTNMKVASDLGALWTLDEAKRQKVAQPLVEIDASEPEPVDNQSPEEDLKDFKPVSTPTVIGNRYRKGQQKPPWLIPVGVAAAFLLIIVLVGLSGGSGKRPPAPRPRTNEQRLNTALKQPKVSPADIASKETEAKELPEVESERGSGTAYERRNADAAGAALPEPQSSSVNPASKSTNGGASPLSEKEGARGSGAAETPAPKPSSPTTDRVTMDNRAPSRSTPANRVKVGMQLRMNHGVRRQLVAKGGGNEQSETAVETGLKWLALHQMPDGGWSFDMNDSCGGQCSHGGTLKADRGAATAMAILPFLGRGYTHTKGPYKDQIFRGINFLASLVAAGQGEMKDSGMYSQGLAGICLSESYAMTEDNRLQLPAQLALNYIMKSQDPVGGGWRYAPKQPGDMSVTGWQMMALLAGHCADLDVNPLVIKKAVQFLDNVEFDDGSQYGYIGVHEGGPATSAVGLLFRMYLGWKKDHPGLDKGVTRLAKMGPSKDLYFDYYATQVIHHVEGDRWIAWNSKMRDMLVNAQVKNGHMAGSWYEGVDQGEGPRVAGRLYCTSLATLILETYYRYPPIFDNDFVKEKSTEF